MCIFCYNVILQKTIVFITFIESVLIYLPMNL